MFKPLHAVSLAAALVAGAVSPALAQGEVNVYSYRETKLIQPLFDAFTKDTGIKVNVISASSGLEQRIKTEGENSPADILLTVDIGRIEEAVKAGITQPIVSGELDKVVPPQLRDPEGHWYAISMRARVVYASKERVQQTALTYEELADPKWKGKICIRSGQHPYNTALIAAMIAHDGPEAAEQWLRGVKANLARPAAGGDRDVARDILGGICDVGIANAYYAGHMKNAAEGSDARRWGDAIRVIRPTFRNAPGTHVNISGAAVARHAPNRAEAVRLLEYLISDKAQTLYAQANYEYPVKAGVMLDPTVASFGLLRIDTLPLTEIARHRKQASELVDRVGLNR